MRFDNGMIGFLIVVLAVGGAIFGTILLSSEESTYDVTKYRYETEVTGLFPVDTSPEYYDYDLSKNYTGYFTDSTVINGVNYWGGATFTQSTTVNNYPIRYHPDNNNTTTAVINLTNVGNMTNSSLSDSYTGISWYNNDYGGTYSITSQSYTKTLSSVLTELNLTGYDVIELKTDISDGMYETVFFGTVGDFGNDRPGHQSQIKAACYVEYSHYQTYPQGDIYNIACHSCKVDNVTHTATFYYNDTTNNTAYVRAVPINDAVVSFSTVGLYSPNNGITISVSEYDVNQIDYMDISKGVTVTGVTA